MKILKYVFITEQKNEVQGQPRGIVVKFAHSPSVARGSQVQIPGADLHTICQAILWQHPTHKMEGDCHRC